jgi:GTP-binding protein LepA
MNKVRNFVIISHIDHGKSTLADRLLEVTGTVIKSKLQPQYLDMMELEREKGITIKMQPARMDYKGHVLNLIDTPGHVDFSYEVSRSLAAVEGGVLLVDATKGVQAQTLANLELAKKQGLVIIAAVNKVDLPQAMTEEVKEQIAGVLDIDPSEVLEISAKTGKNVELVLDRIIEKVPAPIGDEKKPLKALIFDSSYDAFKGIIAYVRVVDGEIGKDQSVYFCVSKAEGRSKEIGYFKPQLVEQKILKAGDIGYIATGIKDIGLVRVGDTATLKSQKETVESLHGYMEPMPMVFAGFYPEDPDEYEALREALEKLRLNDASLVYEPETKEGLGRGFRCGFLGSLHAEIISERIMREFGIEIIISTPSVIFKIKTKRGKELTIFSPTEWPNQGEIAEAMEPWAKVEIVVPSNYMGPVLELLDKNKGEYLETKYLSKDQMILVYNISLRKIIVGFYDKLKSVTQGYASMNYELIGYRPEKLVRLDILLAGKKEEAFSRVVASDEAYEEGKKQTVKLKEVLPRQLFSVPIQAAIEGKVIARETISSKGKDMISGLYGGDYSRKRKKLEQQKKGKKRLKEKGSVNVPHDVFLKMFSD